MLNYFRHILSTRRKAKLITTHNRRLHKMSTDDCLGRALWHCDDFLIHSIEIDLTERLNRTVVVNAPNASELIAAVDAVYSAVTSAFEYTNERYINDVPAWSKGSSQSTLLDLWLVDNEGFFIGLVPVINNLREKLVYIQKQVNDPRLDDMHYHYTTKPKGVYKDVVKLLKHFN